MTTDTSERGLERLICTALTGAPCDPGAESGGGVAERPSVYGVGWICALPEDYVREAAARLPDDPLDDTEDEFVQEEPTDEHDSVLEEDEG